MERATGAVKDARAWPSVGELARPLVEGLKRDAGELGIGIERGPMGCVIVDAGLQHRGGIEAGLRIAEICMAGLGRVGIEDNAAFPRWPRLVRVATGDPVLACLASQYAGWSLSYGEGKDAYQALGSGPGRARAAKEELFSELGYTDDADTACFVLEVDKPPPQGLIGKIVHDCRIEPEDLTLILTPTRSLAGTVQIVARVVEVALHKVHVLGFPLDRIVHGEGSAPLPPPASSFVEAMGRTNDAILYGGRVHITVQGGDGDAEGLANGLPSSCSGDYGKPFAETFASYGGDFYAIDPLLFSPAEVIVTARDSGASFHAGGVDGALVDLSFGHG